MGNRAANERAAIEHSVAMADAPRRRGFRGGGWSTDHELELRSYFSGAHVSAAGLHSSLGAQLARMRDGLGPSTFEACDIPPELRGADERAEEVGAALARLRSVDGHRDVLQAQYEVEPAGRLEGFQALLDDEAVAKKAGRPDLRVKLGDSEAVTPAVAVIAIAKELVAGKSVGGITPECTDVRAALRRICLTAAGAPHERAGEKPKKSAIEAARLSLSRIGTKATVLLKRAQRAYAKARAGASAEEVRRFLDELDAEADAKYSTSSGAR